MQNESIASQMELNHWCLVKIVKTLQLLVRLGLAVFGDNTLKLYTNPKSSGKRHFENNWENVKKA